MKADRIYVLEGAKVVESGSREELMALDGRFRKFYDMQFES
jgi:ABC-type multidrug transport system fused ATPase/permease subunit